MDMFKCLVSTISVGFLLLLCFKSSSIIQCVHKAAQGNSLFSRLVRLFLAVAEIALFFVTIALSVALFVCLAQCVAGMFSFGAHSITA